MLKLVSTAKSPSLHLSVTIVTLLAAVLRFYKLGEWSFWGDEVFTLGTSPDGFVQSMTTGLVHATTDLLGANEWSARLFPAVIGIVTIPIFFYFSVRIFGENIGLVSSLLLAVSPWHLYWSQNARFYVLLLLFYTVALFSFYLAIEKDLPWYMVVSLVSFGLAIQERMLALILLPIITCYLLAVLILPFEKPKGLTVRNISIFFIPGVIVALMFVSPILSNLKAWTTGFGRINNNPIWLLSGFIYYVGLPTICMAATGIIYLLIKKDRRGLFLGIAAALPVLAIMGISMFKYSANRYFFVSLTSWIVLASLAIVELVEKQKGHTLMLAFGALILLVGSALSEDYLYYRYQNGNRENWREAFELIKSNEEEGDLVFLTRPEVGNYYLGRQTILLGEFNPENGIGKNNRAWFLVDLTTEELYPKQLAWIEKNAQYIENFDVTLRGRNFMMRVYLYDPSLQWIFTLHNDQRCKLFNPKKLTIPKCSNFYKTECFYYHDRIWNEL